MILDTLAEDCAWGWSLAASGVRVMLHDQQHLALPEEGGLTVPPGHATSIGARQIQMVKLDGMYRRCGSLGQAKWRHNIYAHRYPIIYSSS